MASSNVIKALAGLEYTVNSDEARGTNQLDKSVYDFEIDTFICQNGMFGRGVYTEADYQAIAETGLKVWIFDGEQDTNNIDTYTLMWRLPRRRAMTRHGLPRISA